MSKLGLTIPVFVTISGGMRVWLVMCDGLAAVSLGASVGLSVEPGG